MGQGAGVAWAVEGGGVTPSRTSLGAAAVLSVTEAARLLPWRDAEARAWLREKGLVRAVPGKRPVVLWSEVLDALRGDEEGERVVRRTATLPRAGLRR